MTAYVIAGLVAALCGALFFAHVVGAERDHADARRQVAELELERVRAVRLRLVSITVDYDGSDRIENVLAVSTLGELLLLLAVTGSPYRLFAPGGRVPQVLFQTRGSYLDVELEL